MPSSAVDARSPMVSMRNATAFTVGSILAGQVTIFIPAGYDLAATTRGGSAQVPTAGGAIRLSNIRLDVAGLEADAGVMVSVTSSSDPGSIRSFYSHWRRGCGGTGGRGHRQEGRGFQGRYGRPRPELRHYQTFVHRDDRGRLLPGPGATCSVTVEVRLESSSASR